MMHELINTIGHQYQWLLSLYAGLAIAGLTLAGSALLKLVPAFRSASRLNSDARQRKMERPSYAANQAWNRKWGPLSLLFIFLLILPFCLTTNGQSPWVMLMDVVMILFAYDFFYYLTHRFLFHSCTFLGGRLLRVHAIHHQQHNPCRMDASYIHPIEVAIGLGLYAATILILALLLGRFHLMTIVVTFIAFTQINLHNHMLWENERFPFKYLHYISHMHHNHHARFSGGNFATITLLYDWMFGTLDDGKGYRKKSSHVHR